MFAISERCEAPPEPGFAQREARCGRLEAAAKKGARGGNMVSPTLNSAEYPVIFSLGG
jgi:hypothetical protein